MRVLVIHDRLDIATAIVEIIKAEVSRAPAVDVAETIVRAREFLQQQSYDLAIVDLTVPVMKGVPNLGFENMAALLTEVFENDDLRPPADIVGISRDAGAVSSIKSSIGEHVLGLILEDPDGRWRELLREEVRYVRNARRGRIQAARTSYDVDVAIITALDKEAQPYEELLELSPCADFHRAREFNFIGIDGGAKRGVLASVGKSGQGPAASLSQALICQLRPRLIMMTGFCGGVKARVALGNVAVFTSAANWDYGKWVGSAEGVPSFQARPDPLNIPVQGVAETLRTLISGKYKFDDAVLGHVFRLLGNSVSAEPTVVSVAAGSGSAVVADERVLSQIVALNENIHAIDMESYGFYYSCLNTNVRPPDFVCIKGVADHCDGEKNSKWHSSCNYLSASLALDVVRRHRFLS